MTLPGSGSGGGGGGGGSGGAPSGSTPTATATTTGASGGDSAADKLAQLNEKLRGTSLLSLLNIKGRPAPDALVARIGELRDIIHSLCTHLPANDPTRATALDRLKNIERILEDPLEWHVLMRAHELRQDPGDPVVRATIETGFFEEHVPRTVWLNAPPDGAHTELRRSMRLPLLVEVDVEIGGAYTRCHTENLSRDGVCIDVPATFDQKQVKLVLHLAATGAKVPIVGHVAWRQVGRVGIAFTVGTQEQNLIDAALQQHFNTLRAIVDRWLAVAPKSPGAIAASCLVGYYSSALPSSRQPFVARLADAAKADSRAVELQLALAKIRLDERDNDGAELALRRAEIEGAKHDARLQLMRETLSQRRGSSGLGMSARLKTMGSGARAALLAVLAISFFASVTAALVVMRGPRTTVDVPPGGLPCARLELLQANALCFVDAAHYNKVPPKDRMGLADHTIQALYPRGVRSVTVYGLNETDGILDMFDEATLNLLLRKKA